MCLFAGVFRARRLCVIDGWKAAVNMWDGTKHCSTAIIYTQSTINTSVTHKHTLTNCSFTLKRLSSSTLLFFPFGLKIVLCFVAVGVAY